jgi:hypothetical protein
MYYCIVPDPFLGLPDLHPDPLVRRGTVPYQRQDGARFCTVLSIIEINNPVFCPGGAGQQGAQVCGRGREGAG